MSEVDLRIQKTYAALTQAFTEMLKVKQFEQITVKELCDAAMIRTATFYNHFSDKYEFADHVIRNALAQYHKNDRSMQNLSGPAYYEQIISDAFDVLESSKDLIHSLASDAILWSISEVIRSGIHDELLEHLQNDKASGRDLSANPELLAEFIIGALEQVVKWWLTAPSPVSAETLKKQLLSSTLRLVS